MFPSESLSSWATLPSGEGLTASPLEKCNSKVPLAMGFKVDSLFWVRACGGEEVSTVWFRRANLDGG